ncbi:hypothetical protein HDV00_006930 [Rhizophlyctis rosea]|nr:hypothetical protein HDV00_006930 [Rhizophlyctis rosea]
MTVDDADSDDSESNIRRPASPLLDPQTPVSRPSANRIKPGYLPAEILQDIAERLPYSSYELLNYVLVSRAWCAGLVPVLWRNLALPTEAKQFSRFQALISNSAATFPYLTFVRSVSYQPTRTLSLSRSPSLDDQFWNIVRQIPSRSLSAICIRHVTVTEIGMNYLLSAAPALSSLTLSDCVLHADLGAVVRNVSKLQHLDVSRSSPISLSTVHSVPCLLRSLHIGGCRNIENADIVALVSKHSSSLISVDLSNSALTVEGLAAITEVSNITSLRISKCALGRTVSDVMGTLFITHFTPLTELDLTMTSGGWPALQLALTVDPNALPNLLTLGIGADEFFEEQECRHVFVRLPHLQSLTFSSKTRFSDRSLRATLDRLPNLHHLHLPTLSTISPTLSTISTSTLYSIPGCCPHLESLSMVGYRVSDDVLRALAGCRRLAQLDLSLCRPEGRNITAEAVGELAQGCRALKCVRMGGLAGFDARKMKWLKGKWPRVRFDDRVAL